MFNDLYHEYQLFQSHITIKTFPLFKRFFKKRYATKFKKRIQIFWQSFRDHAVLFFNKHTCSEQEILNPSTVIQIYVPINYILLHSYSLLRFTFPGLDKAAEGLVTYEILKSSLHICYWTVAVPYIQLHIVYTCTCMLLINLNFSQLIQGM